MATDLVTGEAGYLFDVFLRDRATGTVEHVDLNLVTMGERVIGSELAKSIVDAYLGAKVQSGRHERRRKQIEAMEAGTRVTADSTQGMRRGV